MHIDTRFPTGTALPLAFNLDAAAARAELDRQIREFIADAVRHMPGGDEHPALALRVSPGLGKTYTALRIIAERGCELLARGNILIYVPTLELAEEAHSAFLRVAPHLPSAVIRGRSAERPDGSGPMCERHELASKLAGLVPFLSQALCADMDGNTAPCADGCPYLAQRQVPRARVLFLSHAYLLLAPPIDRELPVALRVIDEAFWPELASTRTLRVDDLMRSPAHPIPQDTYALALRARTALLDALQTGLPIRAHLAEAGIERDALERLARMEETCREAIEVRPNLDDDAIQKRLKNFDRRTYFASMSRERVYKLLLDGDQPDCERLSFAARIAEDQEDQAVLIHSLGKLPNDAPLLMLDASADPVIIKRLVPQARFVRIDAPSLAHVVQAADVVVSNAWLLHHPRAHEHRRLIAQIILREAARAEGRGVLVVATRAVLAALHADAGQPSGSDRDLQAPLHGAAPRWFGPRMRGLNRFSNYATIVVVGRMQPPVEQIEAKGRALFGDDGEPLAPLPDGRLVAQPCLRMMSTGAPRPATVHPHPDARFGTILRQMREENALQAIARLRQMSPDQHKRVVLVGSMPFNDLPVNELTLVEALAEGLEGVESRKDLNGWRRLEAALRTSNGTVIAGTRLTATGLVEDLPGGAFDASGAKEFRKGRPTAVMHDLVHRIAKVNGWPCTSLELSAMGKGGHAAPACVFAPPGQALAAAARLWPSCRAMLMPEPER